MSLAIFLKNNLKSIPPQVGLRINKIPYSLRPGLGRVYRERKKQLAVFDFLSETEKKKFIFNRLFKLSNYAYEKIKFYREFYDLKSFNPKTLSSFDDIQRIPIINKTVLNNYAIEERSTNRKGRYIVNTGGSSGSPFSLYIEPTSMGHEWAHMHHIWEKLNYQPTDLKLVFGGRSDLKNPVEYDVVRNHFAVDIYADYNIVAGRLKKIIKWAKHLFQG